MSTKSSFFLFKELFVCSMNFSLALLLFLKLLSGKAAISVTEKNNNFLYFSEFSYAKKIQHANVRHPQPEDLECSALEDPGLIL